MFSVVVCTRNNCGLLSQVVDVFLKDFLVDQIVVVDNASDDGTKSYLADIDSSKLTVITNNKNNGVIKSRNQGLALATGEYALIIDDDQIPSANTMSKYTDALVDFDIVGWEPQVMNFDTGMTELGSKEYLTYVGAGGMCMKTELWRELGLFDEIFSPAYFEDPDICLKAKKKGCKIGLVDDSGIDHVGHQTLSRKDNGFNSDAIMTRNRKIFLGRYGKKSQRVQHAKNGKIRILYILRNTDTGGVQKNTLDIVKNLDKERYDLAIFVADTNNEGTLSHELSRYTKIYYNRSIESFKDIRIYRNVSHKTQVVMDYAGNTEIVKPGGDISDESFPNLRTIPAFRPMGLKKRQNMQIEDAIRVYKPDIVHFQRDLTRLSKQILSMKAAMNFKIVRSVHGAGLPTSAKGYDKLVLLTRNASSKATKNFKGVSSIMIRNGVDTNVFKSVSVSKRNIVLTHTRLAKLVKMTHHENTYFEVARSVIDQYKDKNIKFVVMGADKSKYNARLKQKAKEFGIESSFEVRDALYGNELVRFMNSCKVWFYPMAKDNFPLSVIEAMCCKLPIVASNLTGIKEMITNEVHGLTCDPHNIQMFVENIIRCFKYKGLASKLAGKAYTKARVSFSDKIMVDKFNNLYSNLV
jgi:glycosyltransferase involved in cell wall biosynthesis